MRSYRAGEVLWRDVLGTNKSGSLSCVFNSRNIADTWWVIKHESSLAESSRGLIFVLLSLQINLQTMLLGHPSTQYWQKAGSHDWMHCICKGKYICRFVQHSEFQASQCFGCNATHNVSSATIDFRFPNILRGWLLAKSPLGRNKPWSLREAKMVCEKNS